MSPLRLAPTLSLGPLVAREAGEDSCALVESCVSDALDYFRRAEGRLPPSRVAADRLGEALADDDRLLYVLSDPQGAPAGLLDLALGTPGPGEVTVALLVLARRLRGRGLGKQVARELFARLRDGGFARVRLGVAPGEGAAAAFWSSLGLWEAGEDDGVRLFELPLER